MDRAYLGGLERQAENPTVDLLDKVSEAPAVPSGELFLAPAADESPPMPPRGGRRGRLSSGSGRCHVRSTVPPAALGISTVYTPYTAYLACITRQRQNPVLTSPTQPNSKCGVCRGLSPKKDRKTLCS
ncbi:hypothetical protein [Methylobacterium sp. Leaf118]|uniref:hypothetical protein n=1 Tax=Methylobacterium sp. Leaf118 TaxID=2876562 RepID=UPI001E58F6A3